MDNTDDWAGGTALRLRALAPSTEDLGLIPNTSMAAHHCLIMPGPGDLKLSNGIHRLSQQVVHTHTHTRR